MKALSLPQRLKHQGSSLLEAVIAVGVLAVAIPLVFGAIAESGKTGISSEAETRSTWIVPSCLEEVRASRDGKPQYFTTTATGQAFPPAGETWALAFSDDGKPIGKVDKALYDKGTKEINGQAVRYLASLSTVKLAEVIGMPPMMRLLISVEYPASSPLAKRQKLDFYTRIP